MKHSLPNETFATFVVMSAMVDDNSSCSSMYRYFSRLSLRMRHTTFQTAFARVLISLRTNESRHSPFLDPFRKLATTFATLGRLEEPYGDFPTL